MNKYNKKQKSTRVKIIILLIIILISIVSCDPCHDSNGKPYKYAIFNNGEWSYTSEDIIYRDNGSITYYDEYDGWVTLNNYYIKEFHCNK